MNNETYTPCTKCGRPMAYCKGQCCGKAKGCHCQEYGPKVCGAIRPGEPKCPYQAVIPSLTVESVSNLKDLADCFVHVSDINTTFYIDDKHRIMTTWAGPVEYNNYDLDANSLGLRSQFLLDFANNRGAYYNKTGNYKVFDFGNNTLSVTLQYDGSDIRGWEIRGQGLIFRIENGSTAGWVEDREVPEGFSFINDATSSPISLDDVFAALNAGEDVVFNGLPIGAYLDTSEEEIYYVPVNGVRVSSSQTIIEEGTDVVIYTGTTLVEMPEGAMVPVGFKLGKYTYTMPEESTSYSLIVQCINGTQSGLS